MAPSAWERKQDEDDNETGDRLQLAEPWGTPLLNKKRSRLFAAAMAVNQAIIELSARTIAWALQYVGDLLTNNLNSPDPTNENLGLWSLHFLYFPVTSTTFASVERQFSLMKKPATIGFLLIDEAGQTINYAPLGLLQRSRRAIFVGDPMQLEPVVTISSDLDKSLAAGFLGSEVLGADKHFLVSESSAQIFADSASLVRGRIGKKQVGLPLVVHRRCHKPMFCIANEIAYNDKMVYAQAPALEMHL